MPYASVNTGQYYAIVVLIAAMRRIQRNEKFEKPSRTNERNAITIRTQRKCKAKGNCLYKRNHYFRQIP